eukprot:CAMPEP_0197517212 /NCGR_PEP_ID=MMETSP1318-20131121/2191_1 /TAXON_ID=552666 /ORGANISM="Partenskyella glossopodia, Strain RCC365" /LENGTH=110 /DNA_ID=CAMNT_0043066595 /DNA_START=136 /DNA_END=468 /DNA_ORIENTATION=+
MNRALRKIARPVANAAPKRGFAQKYVNPKDYKTIWTSDYGAYPVIGVCVVAGTFCAWWNFRLFTAQPRIAWTKTRRSNMIKEEEKTVAAYYNHSLRKLGKAKKAELYARD